MERLSIGIRTAVLLIIAGYAGYSSFHVFETGDYHVISHGHGAAGAALINFLGDAAGPYAGSLFYALFSLLFFVLLYIRSKKV